MNPTYSEADLQARSAGELAMVWNKLVNVAEREKVEGKFNRITRFATKAIGVRKILELSTLLNGESEEVPESPDDAGTPDEPVSGTESDETREKRAEGARKSWENAETRTRRTQRTRVKVDGECYNSVNAACKALGLPRGGHIAFRAKLKANGSGDYQGKHFDVLKGKELEAYLAAQKADAPGNRKPKGK